MNGMNNTNEFREVLERMGFEHITPNRWTYLSDKGAMEYDLTNSKLNVWSGIGEASDYAFSKPITSEAQLVETVVVMRGFV